MATYVKRVQTLLTEAEYRDLARLAENQAKPISVLIREAIEEVYFQPVVRARRQAALRSLLALDAPVSDWPQMEQELLSIVEASVEESDVAEPTRIAALIRARLARRGRTFGDSTTLVRKDRDG